MCSVVYEVFISNNATFPSCLPQSFHPSPYLPSLSSFSSPSSFSHFLSFPSPVQPSLTISPARNVTTRVGMSITITCTDTEGSPAPTFTWTHNNDPLEPDERITFTNDTVTRSSELTITSLMPGDRGTYRCLAVNPRGSANKEIHVNVQCTLTIVGGHIWYHLVHVGLGTRAWE